MIKKILVFLLALTLIFTCYSCAPNNADGYTSNQESEIISTNTEASDDSELEEDQTVDNDSENSSSVKDVSSSDKTSTPSKNDKSDKKDSSDKSNKTDEKENKDDESKDEDTKDEDSGFKLCFHSYNKATCTKPKTCSKCGKTRGKPLGHSYDDATCTKAEACSRCKKTRGEPLGHSYDDATCTTPKKCSKCGITSGKSLGHNYSAATCTAPKTCSKCSATTGKALGHKYSAATCTAPKTCSRCEATSGKALGHKYSAATCTVAKTCSVCGGTSGKPLGHNYVLGECSVCKDYSASYCPKLYFTGDMSQITRPDQTSKKIECNVNFEYRSREQIVNGAAKIKIQGTSSTQYAKKNYTINLYQNSNYSQKMKVDVGWGGQSKYCLKANWIDKTHSRNVVTAKLAAEMQAKYGLFTTAPNNGTIDGIPVEVYINGEFHGLYTMNIPKDEWMFNMDSDNENHIVICGENWNDPVLFKSIPTNLNDWTVEVGPENDATLQKVQRLVDFVLNSSDSEFKANFSQYLNLDSTLNYYIMMHYGWMSDNRGKNMLLATYDGKVWYPTLYDLDTTWGTHWKGQSLYNYSSGFLDNSGNVLWERVEKLYKKEIAARYFELRSTVLDPDHIMDTFNSFYASIPQEVLDREKAKWNTPETPIPGYDFSQIREYLNTVVPRFDARYEEWR